MEIHEYLDLDADANVISCRKCNYELCDADQNFKRYCAMETSPVAEIGPAFDAPADILGEDHQVEFRQFYCPNCAVLMDHEIAREGDEILHDLEIDLEAL